MKGQSFSGNKLSVTPISMIAKGEPLKRNNFRSNVANHAAVGVTEGDD